MKAFYDIWNGTHWQEDFSDSEEIPNDSGDPWTVELFEWYVTDTTEHLGIKIRDLRVEE